jgi:hypothetical protein
MDGPIRQALINELVVLSGLVVTVLAIGHKVRRFEPSR